MNQNTTNRTNAGQPPASACGEVWAAGARDGTLWLPGQRQHELGAPLLALDVRGEHPVATVVGGGDGRLRVYVYGIKDTPLTGHVGPVTVVAFGAEALLSAGADGTARLWKWEPRCSGC